MLTIEDGGEFSASFSKAFGQGLDTAWQQFVDQLKPGKSASVQ